MLRGVESLLSIALGNHMMLQGENMLMHTNWHHDDQAMLDTVSGTSFSA
jgi:hypothetical protein